MPSACRDYYARLERVADVLRDLLLETPPNVGGGIARSASRAWKSARTAQRAAARRPSATCSTSSRSPRPNGSTAGSNPTPIKACFGFDSVVGNFASPYAAGSAYVLLHHVFGEVNGKKGIVGPRHRRHGRHHAGDARARPRRVASRFAPGSGVARVIDARGPGRGRRARRRHRGRGALRRRPTRTRACCSSCSPTMPAAIGASRSSTTSSESATLRMNVALSELPDFTCLPGRDAQPHHSSGIILAPSLAYMDRAYASARAAGLVARAHRRDADSRAPSTIRSRRRGAHVASLFCQHFRYELPGGRSWDDERERAADAVIDHGARASRPISSRRSLGRRVLTPARPRARVRPRRRRHLPRQAHAEPALQRAARAGARRLPDAAARASTCAARARTPGGGVTGVPGHNAAREILRDSKKLKL